MDRRILLFLLLGCLPLATRGAPLHASCLLQWKWSNVECSVVYEAIVSQMIKWNSLDGCDGEKCGYSITSNSSDSIKGKHVTPVRQYKDDLTMKFSGSCTVEGNSSSEVWYAVLDYGTNYCNLHNLVVGAGLDEKYSFKELVEDETCTQYSSADCNKY